jgi:cardiolipin synthase
MEFVLPTAIPYSFIELAWQLSLVGVGLASAVHALLHKRNSRAAAMWLVICLLLPGVGPAAYWLFGFNRVLTRSGSLKGRWPKVDLRPIEARSRSIDISTPTEYRFLCNIGSRVTGRRLVGGNQVRLLENGDLAYPVMLAAIDEAESFVWLSTYIFDRDEVGRAFVDALGRAVERGVDVRVLVDGVGEWYSIPRIGPALRRAGVRFARFLPPRLLPPTLHINLRYHRKILVIDGSKAFTGGMNIGRRHIVERRSSRKGVRDLHFEVVGPVAVQMAEVFREDFDFATGGTDWPELKAVSQDEDLGSHARAVSAGPNEDLDNFRWILLGALAEAKRSIRIMTPYYIAEKTLVSALNTAALRGVEVQLVLPKKNNLPYMTWAANSQLWQLLEFGVRVYYQPGKFSHSKLILIDDGYALIGSANLDPRSLRLNFEFNLELCGGSCPEALEEHFADARDRAREVTLAELDARPLWVRVRDAMAGLLSPYL